MVPAAPFNAAAKPAARRPPSSACEHAESQSGALQLGLLGACGQRSAAKAVGGELNLPIRNEALSKAC